MKIHSLLIGSALVGGFLAYSSFQPRWQTDFSYSPALILYSLNPRAHGHNRPGLIVDKAVISDSNDKARLIEATKEALTVRGSYGEASCFNPRHAVSTSDGKAWVIICFECGTAEIRTKQGQSVVPTNSETVPFFDALVRKYHLKTID